MAAYAIYIADKNNNRVKQSRKGHQGFLTRSEEDNKILEEYYSLWKKSMRREIFEYKDPEIIYNNVHRHAFVLEAADIVFETHKEATDYLENLMKGI